MKFLYHYSRWIELVLGRIGAAAGWLFIAGVAVICVDVITRKFGFQIPGLGSTRLQELEWHFHAVLFSLWLGLAYLRNAHVRIDILVSKFSTRQRAWIELISLFVFALPYVLVLINYGADFAWKSWLGNEGSESGNGLPWRWIPKTLLEIGLILLFFAITAMMAKLIIYLFGPEDLRKNIQINYIGD
jgi:TRAP-type mannitol/chloroaromatic compound transport system permease small subunit